MRRSIHSARTIVFLTALFAVVLGCSPGGAVAAKLYDGSYATDISTSAPGGLTPANGSTSAYPTPFTLGWRRVAGATTYQLEVAQQASSTANCSSANSFQADNIVVSTTTTQTTWVPTLTSADTGSEVWLGTYCWRVRTKGTTNGAWSAGSRFTRSWSGVPTDLKFFNDTDGSIPRSSSSTTASTTTKNAGYFEWSAVDGAATYQIEVASSQSFAAGNVMVRREGIVGTRMVSIHLPDDTYFWRVRAVAPNGTEGGWSTGTNSYTVAWDDPTWDDTSRIMPTDTSTQSELVFGWTPVPGAAWYEYQVATSGGCFWNSTTPSEAPVAFGDWVNRAAVYADSGAPPPYLFSYTPQSYQCRLSDVGATTLNNYITADAAYGSEVKANIAKDCFDEASTDAPVQCLPATYPLSTGYDNPAVYVGASMAVGDEDQPGYTISWRARPVFKITQGTETGWSVGGDVTVYGSWTKYTAGGSNRNYRFDLDPTSGATSSAGSRCESPENAPLFQCLEHDGESMQADQAVGAATSMSLQVPLLSWRRFPGAGGYIVQYAVDPLFNNTVKVAVLDATQHSYIPTTGMVDNSEGTGYWWRAIPCNWVYDYANTKWICNPMYNEDSGGLSPDFADDGVAQTYQKVTEMQTKVSSQFNGAAPLIQWASADVGATDYEGWSAGMEGADHYELQLARDPFMVDGLISILTTTPRAVPFTPGSTAGTTSELADGVWYYRVRAIDRGDISGAWSDVGHFNKRILAPEPEVTGGGSTSGTGVTVSWEPVDGATSYAIQWSTSPAFTSVTGATTHQTSYRIPSTKSGTFYWRVRASIGSIDGLWSTATTSGPKVTIVAATRIRFALNKGLINAKDYAMLDGQLLVSGHARNGKRVQLQAKSQGCDSARGTYSQVAQAVTGRNVDDGMVRFRIRALSNACLRMAWTGDEGVHYSAPIKVRAQPVISFAPRSRSVLRGRGFCGQVRSNVSIRGRVRVQYKVGKWWLTARTTTVKGRTSFRQCAAINRAGSFPLRISIDRMNHPNQGWQRYEPTARTAGRIRVNDSWTVR